VGANHAQIPVLFTHIQQEHGCDESIFAKHKPTHVPHPAAFVGGLFRNLKYKARAVQHLFIHVVLISCVHY
jgi:hypothetical protein